MIRVLVLLVAASLAFSAACTGAGQFASDHPLMNPATLNAEAPAEYRVKFDTSVGTFVIRVTRAWAPHGADRFYNLVLNGFYDEARFFRAIEGFMVQFGIHADPSVSSAWMDAQIPVDPVRQSNRRGYITYAMGGSPTTRTTQVFINLVDNDNLDSMGFAPFGEVVEGLDVVDRINTSYGEGAPFGQGPDQGRIQAEGNTYLLKEFPELDYIRTATIVP